MDKRSAVHRRRRGVRWTSLPLVHPAVLVHPPALVRPPALARPTGRPHEQRLSGEI
ncbi:hypothetical protein THIOKS11450015 [Thiocapsa sp. KS1]|nr:hypothetical protein THIOKS11450015 [Thiocapsa sp. KS1]